MPEPGEKAEPIAMGRQTIWGGAGKPPSRDVMAAAAKAARQEMVQRIREKKGSEGQGQGRGQGDGQSRGGQGQKARGPRPQGGGQGNGGGGQFNNGQQRQRPPRGDRPPRADRPPRMEGEEGHERQPGPNAHLGSLRIRDPRPRQANPNGQPDPLRTGIDAMRTGNRGKNRNKKGGGGGGGGGQRGEGNVDPLRTNYGRIGNN